MPRACPHDVVGGAIEDASCCVNGLTREVSYGEAKEWLDTFFFDRYLHVQSKWSRPWRLHASRSSSVPFFVFDRSDAFTTICTSAATSFTHAPYMLACRKH